MTTTQAPNPTRNMEKFASTLLMEMTEELQKIAVSSENTLQQAQRSFIVVEQRISQLKDFIKGYTFEDTAEEIRFFKEIKPEFQKEQIFYGEILYVESGRPVGSGKALKRFLERELSRIEAFFERNTFFYKYYRCADTSYDEQFFVRNAIQVPLYPISVSDMDHTFSNPYSYKVAKIQALEQLKQHLVSTPLQPVNEGQPKSSSQRSGRRRVFTGPKAAIHEIIRGIIRKGWVNHGEETINSLTEDFEEFFNCKLGNPYRVFISMSMRKKGYTPYLDDMKSAIEDEIEEKFR